jgi:hypothetical protein
MFSAEYKPFSLLIHVTYYGAEHGENGELIMPANSRWDLIQAFKG